MAANGARVNRSATASPALTGRRWHVLAVATIVLLMALPGLSSIPVIDRDEARYAQSSVQMVESGDWVEIRLGERPRNKKPVGAYWAQAGMLSLVGTGEPGERLWAQRLPSVLGALLAALLTYLAAIPMIGRRGAVLAAGMLATSLLFTFEAHIAKTDALLLGSTTAVFAALARLRAGRSRGSAWLFWAGLGASVLIKGPVGPALAGLALLSLLAWERKLRWARPLLRPLPILLFFAIWLPWFVAIGLRTDGAFFAEALGRDFGGKLASAQEDHGGLPGYHALVSWIGLWPASLVLLPGALFSWQAARRGGRSAPGRGMRLVLAWVVPFWIVLELVPTKLPHYGLPLYPAVCIAMAGATMAIWGGGAFARSRWVSAVLFLIVTAALLGLVLSVQVQHGRPDLWPLALGPAVVSAICALVAVGSAMTARMRSAVVAAGLAAVPLSVLTYGVLLPAAAPLSLSARVADAASGRIVSPHYREDSLRYHAGWQRVRLDDDEGWRDFARWSDGTLVLDLRRDPDALETVRAAAGEAGICLSERARITGFNYTLADPVELVLLNQAPCATATTPAPE